MIRRSDRHYTAYLDRVKIGFAALPTRKDLGLAASMLGFGTFIFGHFTCEVLPTSCSLPFPPARPRYTLP